MIFSGPFAPKFMAEACVASEKVGEGGPCGVFRLELDVIARVRRGRDEGIVNRVRGTACKGTPTICTTFSCAAVMNANSKVRYSGADVLIWTFFRNFRD